MNPATEWKELEDRAVRLESILDREQSLSQRASRRSLILAALIALAVLFFFVLNFVNLGKQFSAESLAKSLEAEIRELSPTAQRELEILGRQIYPVYWDEARKQFPTLRPVIFTRLEREIDQLSGDVVGKVHRQLVNAQEQVLARVEALLLEHYPSLRDPTRREALTRRLHELTEDATLTAIGNFHRRFNTHCDDVRRSLLQFDVSDGNESIVDLQKKFLHLWLQLLDEEIAQL